MQKTNLEINYEDWIDEDNENTIVILHWWGWSSQSWLSMWELLFQSWFNVIIPDLPWFWKTKLKKVISTTQPDENGRNRRVYEFLLKPIEWKWNLTKKIPRIGFSITLYAINNLSKPCEIQ